MRITRRSFLTGSVILGVDAIFGATCSIFAQRPAATVGPADPGLIDDLVAANRILANEGVLDGFGHVTARHNRDASRFLMSRSLAPQLVTASDLIEFDLDGNPVDAKGQLLYSERFIHSEIYRARPDIKAVVHTHAPSLIPFSVSSVPLRPVYHMAGFIDGSVPVWDIRKTDGLTDMLVSNIKRGRGLAGALGSKTAILMRGHGGVTVGSTLPIAVGRAIYLELDARIQVQAMGLGGNITYLDPQEARNIMESGESRGYERPWELWKKKALGR